MLEDVDFRAKVTREKFEELCSDMFERVSGPVEQALEAAGMTMVREGGREGGREGRKRSHSQLLRVVDDV